MFLYILGYLVSFFAFGMAGIFITKKQCPCSSIDFSDFFSCFGFSAIISILWFVGLPLLCIVGLIYIVSKFAYQLFERKGWL